MKSGAVVSNGTDAPVEDVSPIASYYATVSRKLADGSAFYPDQRMSRVEALKSHHQPAYAAFEEESKGTLKVGRYADVVVLSKDTSPCRKVRFRRRRWTTPSSPERSSSSSSG